MGASLVRRYPCAVGGSGLSLFGKNLSVRLAIGWVDDVLIPLSCAHRQDAGLIGERDTELQAVIARYRATKWSLRYIC
jgi:hypothetical protein